jgi:hypothetical protein
MVSAGTLARLRALQRRRNVNKRPGPLLRAARSTFSPEGYDCTLRLERARERAYVVRCANVAPACLEYRPLLPQLHEAEP